MDQASVHSFHIPVMGLGYTIDTPIKVARFGISSVVSIIQDILIEQMREYYCRKSDEVFIPIPSTDRDHRAKRITAYLNLMQRIIDRQIETIKEEPFEKGNDIVRYFEMLPEDSPLKTAYHAMNRAKGEEKYSIQTQLRKSIVAGPLDVNIMTKIDNPNYSPDGQLLPPEYSDAQSAFRGFAESSLQSSIIFSAGMNPRLFALIENYPDFFPDQEGHIRKKITLKVSDYRSALIQGKFLAKKGLWVSEFRIESGLNCGGHAFPTEGYLLGPILEEFRERRDELTHELSALFNQALREKNYGAIARQPDIRITVQGGIGTSAEDRFLREYYNLDGTGWGSTFLLVPEATNVDSDTLMQLTNATREDYYLSHASPLGVPFNNFRKSSSEAQRKKRIEKKRAGSPCYKKYLSFNTEFTEKPICVASREYQHKKLNLLKAESNLSRNEIEKRTAQIVEKDCLCEGLSAPALLTNNIPDPHHLEAVTICPGPNLAYFSRVCSLEEMVGHIYGRVNVRNDVYRPHMFINELKMYIEYLVREIEETTGPVSEKRAKYFSSFKENILSGIQYYRQLIPRMKEESEEFILKMMDELEVMKVKSQMCVPSH